MESPQSSNAHTQFNVISTFYGRIVVVIMMWRCALADYYIVHGAGLFDQRDEAVVRTVQNGNIYTTTPEGKHASYFLRGVRGTLNLFPVQKGVSYRRCSILRPSEEVQQQQYPCP